MTITKDLAKERLKDVLKKQKHRLIVAIKSARGVDHIPFHIAYEDILLAGPDVVEWVDEYTLDAISIIKDILVEIAEESALGTIPELDVGIVDLPKYTGKIGYLPMAEIKARHINRYISTEGIANHVGQPVPLLAKKAWVCDTCGEQIYQERKGRFYGFVPKHIPEKCPKEGCPGDMRRAEDRDIYYDEQTFILQELPSEAGEREPRRIFIVLRHSMVGKPQVLHQAKVHGVVKLLAKKPQEEIYDYYIDAYAFEEKGFKYKEEPLTPEDIKMCKELVKKDKNIILNMAKSLVPRMRGNELIKIALLLQQIRGTELTLKDGTKVNPNLHILWVSDPGTRKSTTGQHIAKVTPSGEYVMAPRATLAATTAMAEKDKYSGEWRLVAGAVPRASGGVCIIDEIDKCSDLNVLRGIREVMAQRSLTVHSGGIHTILPADTSILLTLNPKAGRLTEEQLPGEQLPRGFDTSFLDRIDIPLVAYDKPNPEEDRKMAEHMLAIYQGKEDLAIAEPAVYPENVVKKYIQWTRTHKPLLDDDAAKYLTDFYVNMRKIATLPGLPVPIGRRQIETLVKLSAAFAKAFGSNKITVEHAKMAVELLKDAFKKWKIDIETGVFDIDLLERGISRGMQENLSKILRYFKEKDKNKKGLRATEVIEDLKRMGIQNPTKALELLVEKGELYRPRSGVYALA